MRDYMNYLFLLPLFLIMSVAKSQVTPKTIDSLNKETQKNLRNPIQSNRSADSTLKLAEKINYLRGQATATKLKGISLYLSGDLSGAFTYYEKALTLFTNLQDTLEIGKAQLNLATYYNAVSNYEKSIEWGLKALQQFEYLNDLNGVGRVYNLIGQSYYFQGDYPSALKFFHQHLGNARKAGDSVEIASSWSNIGAVHDDLEYTDSAMYYLSKAIALKEHLQVYQNIGSSYFNLGVLYAEKKQYQDATENLLKAENYYLNVGDSVRLAELYVEQGNIKHLLGRNTEAISILEKAISLASRIGNLEMQKSGLEKLANVYETENNYRKAYETLQSHDVIANAILNEKNIQSLNQMRTQFDTEKKELLLAEQQLMLKKNSWLITFLLLTLALLITIVIFWRRQTEIKKKQEKLIIEQAYQKQLIESTIASQEKERARFAKDLHDGFGQLISSTRLFISRSNESWAKSATDLLDQMHLEIRNIAFALLPNALVYEGVVSAIRELAGRLNDSNTIKISVTETGMENRLSQQIEVSLYRVCQEWINNVFKYSNAKSISIQFVNHDDHLSLVIEDDGQGFDPIQLQQGKGNGWKNIQSRIGLHAGTVFIESKAGGSGSSLMIEIPLQKEATMRVA
ncbi:MAG: tetratricopeptide repeat protein [Cyclobacteriaceae bacterium]